MTRLIIRHLTGAKANQEVSFDEAAQATAITIGRDATCRFAFDDADDAVSRQHARVEQGETGYVLVDAGSANGTLVNRVPVHGKAALTHGDIVQFGRGGPQVSIHLDPPPPAAAKATRLVSDTLAKPTRLAETSAGADSAKGAAKGTAQGAVQPSRVGRATVERMLGTERDRSRRLTVNIVAGVVAVAGAIGIWQVIEAKKRDESTSAQIAAAKGQLADTNKVAGQRIADVEAKANLARRIKNDYGASTVYIEAAWRLTETNSGRQIFHSYVKLPEKGTFPAYIRLEDGSYEPLLTTEDKGGANRPIASSHSGTGFVVSDNGLIMTNRHVAAAWHAPYGLKFPGVVLERQKNDKGQVEMVAVDMLDSAPESLSNWVPSRSRFFKTMGVADSRSVTGVLNSLSVTFAGSKLRNAATLGTISPEADVALIKVEAGAGILKKVELRDSYESLASGDTIVALGYPGVSAKTYMVTNSADALVKDEDVAMVPEVSVNQGIVSKVVRGNKSVTAGKVISTNGDLFEMSINSSGQGNSGGPVFDADGKVVGIFSTIGRYGGATLTGAIPIRYGLELLDPTRSAVAQR
ncbi:MAG: trypsin-like peptidase domain-containing protein [Rubrivivax sp.]|nr:trypsin-like peptidase domain-containing protein [Rubrivivax sp.]